MIIQIAIYSCIIFFPNLKTWSRQTQKTLSFIWRTTIRPLLDPLDTGNTHARCWKVGQAQIGSVLGYSKKSICPPALKQNYLYLLFSSTSSLNGQQNCWTVTHDQHSKFTSTHISRLFSKFTCSSSPFFGYETRTNATNHRIIIFSASFHSRTRPATVWLCPRECKCKQR